MSRKSIQTEIWFVKGEDNFSGKDSFTTVNIVTGKAQDFTSVGKHTHPDGGNIEPKNIWGANDFVRAKWFEDVIKKQSETKSKISVWFTKGEKVFSGKDIFVIVDETNGNVQEFEGDIPNKAPVDEGFEFVDSENIWGANGWKPARWSDII